MKALLELPVDILFMIALALDSASIARLSATCSRWKVIMDSFSNLIYKRVAARDFKLLTLPANLRSYHQIVLVNEAIRRGKCYATDVGADHVLSGPKYYLMAWPESESNSYLVALSGNLLIWVDTNDMINMFVKDLRLHDWSLDVIGYDYTLQGHTDRIGLILSNQKGLLVSFDISCDIYVWNLMTREMSRKINTRGELGMIMSMNLHDTSVVCAGINGKIAVWDVVNGDLIHSFSIPSVYMDILEEHQLNVSIYGKLVAFGLSDGKFYVYSLTEKKVMMQLDVKKPRFSKQYAYSNNLLSLNLTESQASELDIQVLPDNAAASGENSMETHGIDMQDDQLIQDDSESEASIFDVLPLHESSVPLTLSLSSHFLLTNGPNHSSLAIWDIFSGELMAFLDKSRGSSHNSRFSYFRFAEISADGSMIFSVNDDLFIWNFVDLNHSQFQNVHRYFLKKSLEQGEEIWIGYETHSK